MNLREILSHPVEFVSRRPFTVRITVSTSTGFGLNLCVIPIPYISEWSISLSFTVSCDFSNAFFPTVAKNLLNSLAFAKLSS